MATEINSVAVLSLIVGPAVLTNACSMIIMSTSNRFARAVDRGRELSKQLEDSPDLDSPEAGRSLRELKATEERSLMLLVALRSFYIALGGFASATLFSLLSAVTVSFAAGAMVRPLEIMAVMAGTIAVGALFYGSLVLVRETRIVVRILQQHAAVLQEKAATEKASKANRI